MTGPSQLEFATVYRENFGWLAAFFARRLYAQHLASEAGGAGLIDQIGGQLILADDEVEDLAERIDAQRDGKELLERAARLSEGEREAIELVDLMDRTPKDAARVLDISPNALRVRLFRAHSRLRKEPRRGGPPARAGAMTAFEDGLWTRRVEEHDADRVALHTAPEASSKRPQFATRRTRWLAAAAATIIVVPGVAFAAGAFTSSQTVARSLAAGARIFGSTPTCTVVQPNVEYRCMLARRRRQTPSRT